jgi:hypothetical protein
VAPYVYSRLCNVRMSWQNSQERLFDVFYNLWFFLKEVETKFRTSACL